MSLAKIAGGEIIQIKFNPFEFSKVTWCSKVWIKPDICQKAMTQKFWTELPKLSFDVVNRRFSTPQTMLSSIVWTASKLQARVSDMIVEAMRVNMTD